MAAHAEQAGLFSVEVFKRHYDARTEAAVHKWMDELSADLHDTVDSAIRDATDAAETWWRAAQAGSEDPPEPDPDDAEDPVDLQGFGGGLIAPVGAEDNAHPATSGGAHALRLLDRR